MKSQFNSRQHKNGTMLRISTISDAWYPTPGGGVIYFVAAFLCSIRRRRWRYWHHCRQKQCARDRPCGNAPISYLYSRVIRDPIWLLPPMLVGRRHLLCWYFLTVVVQFSCSPVFSLSYCVLLFVFTANNLLCWLVFLFSARAHCGWHCMAKSLCCICNVYLSHSWWPKSSSLLSHINSCKSSRVRGHIKVLEPWEDPETIMKSKFGREILRFPT